MEIIDRVFEIEPVIIKHLRISYYYARDIIEGRWPEAEEFIKKDPEYTYRYKGRWPEAEEAIKRSNT